LKKLLLTITFWFAFTPQGWSQSVDLPLDHWAYSFLFRAETKGYIDRILSRTVPYSREEIGYLIQEIEQNRKEGKITLSNTESSLFEKLKGEFIDEVQPLGVAVNPKEKEPHLLRWQEENNQLYIDVYFIEDWRILSEKNLKDKNSLHTTLGGIIRGYLSERLYFYVDFRNTLLEGDDIQQENFDPSQGLPVSISGSYAFTNQATAYLVYKLPFVEFWVGRAQSNWGPGYRGNLALSKNALVFNQYQVRVSFKRFRYLSTIGYLHSSFEQKNIAAHRLEVYLTPSLVIGAGETVIYGNRGIEFLYALPIMPYHIAEHHLGDKDNNNIFIDIHYRSRRNFSLYGELYIDDFSTWEDWFRYYGNKFAFTLGGVWIDPFHLSDTELRCEYSRIEPYVYTHRNKINTYLNYDRIIGHWLGPDADALYMEISHMVNRSWHLRGSWEYRRNGQSTVYQPHLPSDGTDKHFLNGTVEYSHSFRFGITFEIHRDVVTSLDFHYSSVTNFENVEYSDRYLKRFQLTFWFNL